MMLKYIKGELIDRVKNNSNYFSLSASILFARGLGGVITILIVRSLTGAEFASFSAGFFIMTILGYSTNGLDKSFVFQYIHQNRKDNKQLIESYIWLKLIIFIFLILLSIVIIYLSSNFIKFKVPLLVLGVLYSSSFWLFTLILSMYQAKQEFKKYGLVQILYYITVFAIAAFLTIIHKSFSELFLLAYFIGILSLTVFIIPYKEVNISYYKNEVITLLDLSKWLIISELCWLLFIRVDYFTISHYLSKSILGEYAIALRTINILSILVSSLSIYILPKVAEIKRNVQLQSFWRKSNFLTFSLLLIYGIIFILSREIISILYGSNHLIAIRYFKEMIIAYSPMIFIPAFKYLILKFNRKYHYFIFNFILIATYFITLPIYSNRISNINSPIYSKGTGFLIALLYGIMLYYFRNKKILK